MDTPDNLVRHLETRLVEGPSSREDDSISKMPQWLEASSQDTRIKCLKVIGDYAGAEESWRIPFGKCGILAYALTQLAPDGLAFDMTTQQLRVIGNCVVDTDENRLIAQDYIPKLLELLHHRPVSHIAITVLFNLANDFKPAQEQLAICMAHVNVTKAMQSNNIPLASGFASRAIDVLFWAVENIKPAELLHQDSIGVFHEVLSLLLQCADMDEYTELLPVVLLFTQHEEFRERASKPDIFAKLVDVLLDSVDKIEATDQASDLVVTDESGNSTNHALNYDLANAIATISAARGFELCYEEEHSHPKGNFPLIPKLVELCNTPDLAACACTVLGNLAFSKSLSLYLVEQTDLVGILERLLSQTSSIDLLYASLGCLKHLAFVESNRPHLCNAKLMSIYASALAHSDARVRLQSISLIRKAIENTPDNLDFVISDKGTGGPEETTVSLLLGQSEPQSLVLETGRTIIALLRTISQSNRSAEFLQSLCSHQSALIKPVIALAQEKDNKGLRLEGLFGLGLLARNKQSIDCIAMSLHEDGSILDTFRDILKEEGPARDNTVVIIDNLMTYGDEALDEETKTTCKGLIAEWKMSAKNARDGDDKAATGNANAEEKLLGNRLEQLKVHEDLP